MIYSELWFACVLGARGSQLQAADSRVHALCDRVKVTEEGIPVHQGSVLSGRGQRSDNDVDHTIPVLPEGALFITQVLFSTFSMFL